MPLLHVPSPVSSFKICSINPTSLRITDNDNVLTTPSVNQVKLENLRILANDESIDIIVISASWFNENVLISYVNIPGYNDRYRCDRQDGYGGMAFYASTKLNVRRCEQFEMGTVDNVCIKIELEKHSVYVLGLYRPPKVSSPLFTAFIKEFEEKVQSILSLISPNDVQIIAGDLNVQ